MGPGFKQDFRINRMMRDRVPCVFYQLHSMDVFKTNCVQNTGSNFFNDACYKVVRV